MCSDCVVLMGSRSKIRGWLNVKNQDQLRTARVSVLLVHLDGLALRFCCGITHFRVGNSLHVVQYIN